MKHLRMLAFIVALAASPVTADDAPRLDAPRLDALEQLDEEPERRRTDEAVAADAPVKLGMFFVESADGAHRLELGGRLMIDARFGGRDETDGVQVRRGRVELSGRLARIVTFKLGLEFGRTSDADLRDAYVNVAAAEWLQLRAGQMLPPFSTEGLTSSNFMKLPERPIVVGSLVDSRELGLMLHGKALGGRLAYYAAVFNGNGQNVGSDGDDAKDAALRIEGAPVEALRLALSYRYTPPDRGGSRGPSDVRTVGNQLTRFLDYDTGRNRHRSSRERGSIDARVRAGRLEVKGELLVDRWRDVASRTGARADLVNWGWFVDASYVLTGEDAGDELEPARPFLGQGALGPGAWELSARYEEFHADAETIVEEFAVGARTVRAASVALTWTPVRRVRALVSYTYSTFDAPVVDARGDPRADDHALIVRLGLWF